MKNLIAIDLGAGSGRVILGVYDGKKLSLSEYHRFINNPIKCENHICWDIESLLKEIKTGIDKILQAGILPDCIAIDSWGVDFVLTDRNGGMLGLPVTYRDERTKGVMDKVIAQIGGDAIYKQSGIQFLSFNTLYQLVTLIQQQPCWLDDVDCLQFIPDYLGFRLTGQKNCEFTNATTSQMVDCHTGEWSSILDDLAIPRQWLLPIQAPNRLISHYRSERFDVEIPFASVASHDTASAVLAVPFDCRKAAYLSSGTWSLMGMESLSPLVNAQAQQLNITNEGGAEGRFRVLKNIMGLWIVQRIQHELESYSFSDLVSLAETAPAFVSLINPDHAMFLNPPSMVEAVQAFCYQTEQPTPQSPGALIRCVLESLALQYRSVWVGLNALSEQPLEGIHIVGGGSQNALLNQWCADACGCPVWAGPIEASVVGNLCGQLIALQALSGVDAARRLVRDSFTITTYHPEGEALFSEQWQRFIALCNTELVEQDVCCAEG
ncbi:rhamnulokinase [Photobacterium sp. ZSDE20]|uniref:Rhamnulokinase n=1 Tax=Photobacterium pectinilyticum TaxID=2906793 RepID=A0ABT1N4I6_9GAMM|nr:rhamnulokinase [Photobacterium sp. ZSDE20]MCQ1059647.1 rhamnulokinase [Photobacterium sp. ZSDE20]MDD1825839.1 rhamnulokinase [Photobacterium sp. ZSDE20]